MSWIYLILAGLFEVGWPVGLKLAQQNATRGIGIFCAISCVALSGLFLWLAQKQIPIGSSYAIWTGIGTIGTFIVGVIFFGDSATIARFLGVALIIIGVTTLKLAN